MLLFTKHNTLCQTKCWSKETAEIRLGAVGHWYVSTVSAELLLNVASHQVAQSLAIAVRTQRSRVLARFPARNELGGEKNPGHVSVTKYQLKYSLVLQIPPDEKQVVNRLRQCEQYLRRIFSMVDTCMLQRSPATSASRQGGAYCR
jgi:hypothetical protein